MFINLGNPVSSSPLNNGLVGWWLGLRNNSGSPTWFDLVNQQNGTLVSGYSWSALPNQFNGLSLSSSNAYLPDRSFGTGAYSAACWVYPTALSGYQNLLRSDSGLGGVGNFWFLRVNGTGLEWYPSNIGGVIGVGSLSNNNWYLVVGTRDGSGNSALYLNGVQLGTNTGATNNAGGSGNPTWIGSLSGSIEFFAGTVGAAWMWNRALSTDDVWRLYDQTLRGYPDTLRRRSRRSSVYVATSPPPASTGKNLLLLGVG